MDIPYFDCRQFPNSFAYCANAVASGDCTSALVPLAHPGSNRGGVVPSAPVRYSVWCSQGKQIGKFPSTGDPNHKLFLFGAFVEIWE